MMISLQGIYLEYDTHFYFPDKNWYGFKKLFPLQCWNMKVESYDLTPKLVTSKVVLLMTPYGPT